MHVMHVTCARARGFDQVDERQATPEDYTIVIEQPPISLGAAGLQPGTAALGAYKRFFQKIQHTSNARLPKKALRGSISIDTRTSRVGGRAAERAAISEFVIVKTTSEFLRLRRAVKRMHRRIETAIAREQQYLREGGADAKRREALASCTAEYIRRRNVRVPAASLLCLMLAYNHCAQALRYCTIAEVCFAV